MSQKLFYLLILLLPIQIGRHFWPEGTLVLGIRVDYLSPTLYLTDIIIIFIIITWLLGLVKNRTYKIKNLLVKLLLAIFVGFLLFIFTVLNAPNQTVALYKFTKLIEFLLLGLFVVRTKPKLVKLIPFLSLSLLYSSFIALFQFLKQSSLGGPFWLLGERSFNAGTPGIAQIDIFGRLFLRSYATFPHPNVLGGFLVMGLTALYLNGPQSLPKNKFLLACFLLSLLALILTFSLSAFVALALGACLTLWFFRKKFNKSYLAFGGFFLIFIFFFFELFIKFSSARFIEDISLRSQLNNTSLAMWLKNPLFGVGLNNFIPSLPRYLFLKNKIFWWQPVHNIYFLTLAETGLLGLLLFFVFIFFAIKNALKLKNQKVFLPIILLSEALLIGLFDHYFLTLQQGQLMMVLIFTLAFLPKSSYT